MRLKRASPDPSPDLEENLPDSAIDPVAEVDEGPSRLRGLVEWLWILLGAVLLALVLRTYVMQGYWTTSGSMEETLQVKDRVLVNRLSYRLHEIGRGDIVVFEKPLGVSSDADDLIKRVMALEGETIEARNNALYIDGFRVFESYLARGEVVRDFGPVVVPQNQVFVMGDNRDNSSDSRAFGPIDIESIVGRATVLYWPLGRFDWL